LVPRFFSEEGVSWPTHDQLGAYDLEVLQ